MLVCRTSPGVGQSGCCRLHGYHPNQAKRRRRYPSDLTDHQWAILDPLLPDPAWATPAGGRPEKHCRRCIVDAILYINDNGIKWRSLPGDFPPWPTVYTIWRKWEKTTASQTILDTLRGRDRLAHQRHPTATAAVIDSASIKGSPEVSAATRGYDAGKKINGRKRHISVDTQGNLITVVVTPASVQDRDGAKPLLEATRAIEPNITKVWADGGYAGKLVDWAQDQYKIDLDIVKRNELHCFKVLPRRWVVERTLGWIDRNRRCVKDYERLPENHEAWVRWTEIRRLLRHHP